jgi:sulfur carrier protein ThiS
MEIEISMLKEKKKLQMDEGATGKDLISLLNFVPDEVILVAGGNPIPYDQSLRNGDRVKVIRVASGG